MPAATKPLHLLRALLREASYLPDATARGYFRRYIVSRYKAYQPKENATASFDVKAVEKYRHRSFKRRQIAIINERTRPMLRKGQKGLNFLRRANQGEIPCLQKALYFAYGRLGRRKYALLDNLLKPDPVMEGDAPPKDVEGPTPLQKLYFSNKRYLQFFDAPKATSPTHHLINISDRYSRLRAVLKSIDKSRAEETSHEDAHQQYLGAADAHQASAQQRPTMVCRDHEPTAPSAAKQRVGQHTGYERGRETDRPSQAEGARSGLES
jgi:hypothetical protein